MKEIMNDVVIMQKYRDFKIEKPEVVNNEALSAPKILY